MRLIPPDRHSRAPSRRLRLHVAALVCVVTGVLTACATTPSGAQPWPRSIDAGAAATDSRPIPSSPSAASAALSPVTLPSADDPAAQPVIVRGSDRLFGAPAPRPPIQLNGKRISLNFDQAPVAEVIHAVLGDLLGQPYVISQPVAGSITLQTHNPLPQDQIFAVFESLLQANGLAIVRDGAGILHVGPPDQLRGIAPVFGSFGSLPAGHKMVVVPLRFIGAQAMSDILSALASADAILRVDSLRNLVVVAGTGPQIEGWLQIVDSFDVDVLAGMSVGLFPLQHIAVEDMQKALQTVFAGLSGESDGTSAGAAGLIRMMPIGALNALLVVTPRAHYLDKVRDWVLRFDRNGSHGTEPQLYVFPVQNGAAGHLAELLNAVFGGESRRKAGSERSVAPGLAEVTLGTDAAVEDLRGDAPAQPGRERAPATRDAAGQAGAITQVSLGDDIRVVADERNNALLIYAPPAAYSKIEAALRRLDISPNQVLIEASILEVSLTDDLKYGLQWTFNNGHGGGLRGTGVLGTSATGAIATGGSGFSYTLTNGVGQIRAVLNALADKSLLNVISSPSVLVQDNQTATIKVGDQQPVRSARAVTDGGTSIESIEFKDTGVMLTVTPSVNAGGLVSMLIDQSVTDVGPQDEATGQRSFLQRQISSRVSVRSGESVVLGGLIRDNTTRGRQGIPGLQDIPLFGNLFSTTTRNASRTELLVMITPRVLRSERELRQAGDELRRRMRSLERLPERIGVALSTPFTEADAIPGEEASALPIQR